MTDHRAATHPRNDVFYVGDLLVGTVQFLFVVLGRCYLHRTECELTVEEGDYDDGCRGDPSSETC
jgi:hypothetical protein